MSWPDAEAPRNAMASRDLLRDEFRRFAHEELRAELEDLRVRILRDVQGLTLPTVVEAAGGGGTGGTGAAAAVLTPAPPLGTWAAPEMCGQPVRHQSFQVSAPDEPAYVLDRPGDPANVAADTTYSRHETLYFEAHGFDDDGNFLSKSADGTIFSDRMKPEPMSGKYQAKKKAMTLAKLRKRQMQRKPSMRRLSLVESSIIGSFIMPPWITKTFEFFEDAGEYIVAFAICINGLFIGVQTKYQADNLTEDVPLFFTISEFIFCFIFTAECVSKLFYQKFAYLSPQNWRWNIFDLFLVILQLVEVVGMVTSSDGADGSGVANMTFLRMFRMLRLCRIFRLVRLMQFVGELNAIVSSIANSMRPLFWTMVLLSLLIYIVGILFTQLVFTHAIDTDGGYSSDPELAYWWGSLSRVFLSLYQAIMGGVDWDDLTRPLMKISWYFGPMFVLYMAFAMLAMMNVITGIFVNSAIAHAEQEKDQDFSSMSRELFCEEDEDETEVTWDVFEKHVNQPGNFQAYVRSIGIEPKDAKIMFKLLDSDESGSLDMDELLGGMIRLRAGAKFLDVAIMVHDFQQSAKKQEGRLLRLEELLAESVVALQPRASAAKPEARKRKASLPSLGPSRTPVKDVASVHSDLRMGGFAAAQQQQGQVDICSIEDVAFVHSDLRMGGFAAAQQQQGNGSRPHTPMAWSNGQPQAPVGIDDGVPRKGKDPFAVIDLEEV